MQKGEVGLRSYGEESRRQALTQVLGEIPDKCKVRASSELRWINSLPGRSWTGQWGLMLCASNLWVLHVTCFRATAGKSKEHRFPMLNC